LILDNYFQVHSQQLYLSLYNVKYFVDGFIFQIRTGDSQFQGICAVLGGLDVGVGSFFYQVTGGRRV
jgi:hypothetical protein